MIRAARIAAGDAATRAMRLRPQVAVARAMARHLDSVGADSARALSTAGSNGIPKGINTTNPFEIKFHVEDLPEDAAAELAGIESCFFEDEIEKFHSEMIGVFGSEPEEHGSGDGQPAARSSVHASTSRDTTTLSHTSLPHDVTPPIHPHIGVPPRHSSSAQQQPPVRMRPSQPVPVPVPAPSDSPSLVLIQGPCTYVHHGWVGSKDRWSTSEVETMVERIAHSHGLHVAQHHSNHEGQILDWLLTTTPGDKIILNWNGRLADSPTVYRALASIRAFVVVLAPLDVELGPLPPSVKGVITGFGTRSLELAIQACK